MQFCSSAGQREGHLNQISASILALSIDLTGPETNAILKLGRPKGRTPHKISASSLALSIDLTGAETNSTLPLGRPKGRTPQSD